MNIYFLTPNYFSGGIKMIYRHVELLSQHNFQAYVLCTSQDRQQKIFPHIAKIKYWNKIQLTSTDIVVIPEYLVIWTNPEKNPTGLTSYLKRRFSKNRYKYLIKEIFDGPAKKVIYNQNPYYTFWDYPPRPNSLSIPYTRENCLATVCVSDNNLQYLKLVFPEIPIHRIFYSIDPDLFKPTKKKRQIAYLTFKNIKDVSQVINILLLRGNLHDFSLLPVEGTEQEVSQALNESMVMLNFGNIEGFGLPAAEGMLSKCVVIGYHGGGGQEFMKSEYCFPIDNGDIIKFVTTIENVVEKLSKDEGSFNDMTDAAREFIKGEYSKEKEKLSVISAWQKITDVV